jgi:hypothetical protein
MEDGDREAALLLAKLYLVSEKEHEKVRELLGVALSRKPDFLCDESIEEAHRLLAEING